MTVNIDFETYSEAGWERAEDGTWRTIMKNKSGLEIVGAHAYCSHPSARVTSLSYNMGDGTGTHLWVPAPGIPNPKELIDHLRSGGTVTGWNLGGFEFYVINLICAPQHGWPTITIEQIDDTMAEARAFFIPGGLADAGSVLGIEKQKLKSGTALLNLFSVIQKNGTILDPLTHPRGVELYQYNIRDTDAEIEIKQKIPRLSESEREIFLIDQRINRRGVQIDTLVVNACIALYEEVKGRLDAELQQICYEPVTEDESKAALKIVRDALPELKGRTIAAVKKILRDEILPVLEDDRNGDGDKLKILNNYAWEGLDIPDLLLCINTALAEQIKSGTEAAKLIRWLNKRGCNLTELSEETVTDELKTAHTPEVIRALQIRQQVSLSSVKKLYALKYRISPDNRCRDLFAYYAAGTGRWGGRGAQPQNLPSSGPVMIFPGDTEKTKWSPEVAERCLEYIVKGDWRWMPDPLAVVSGCLRSLFIAGPGKRFICSDYSAIEAVNLACLAGEQWRIDVFRTHGKIYEMSASKISGIPFEEFLQHKKTTGDHHPLRKKIGKVAELASGYAGGEGAWIRFGADEYMTKAEINANIKKWRAESPEIVKFWHKIQDASVMAVQYPGHVFDYRGVAFKQTGSVLACKLPSGRYLYYHDPKVENAWLCKKEGKYKTFKNTEDIPRGWEKAKEVFTLTYMRWHSQSVDGVSGWLRTDTYGGRLTENIDQAISRDILAYAMINLEKAGYTVVMHVHDEIVAEVDENFGSIEEFERIMATLPPWAAGWPLRAAGGWIGYRYKKD